MSFVDVPPVAIQVNQGCLIATLQFGSDPRVLERFRSDLLERLKTSEAKGVAIDLSSVDVLDATDFDFIKRTIVLVGIRPGVAASLVELPVELGALKTALSVEEAIRWLRASG